jgi:chitosanase
MAIVDKKNLIQSVINVFETGTPEGCYDQLVVYADGVNGTRQVTFGRSQTTEQGNLAQLIDMYVENDGAFADDFEPYLEKIGKVPLADDETFKQLLVRAARKDPLMHDTQDAFFDKVYWTPALQWFERNGFVMALSMLVVYDSYIHSGAVPMFLRRRFAESVPSNGGDEKKWIAEYVAARHAWLKDHVNPLLRKTIYRTRTFLNEIARQDWDLDNLPIDANGTKVA